MRGSRLIGALRAAIALVIGTLSLPVLAQFTVNSVDILSRFGNGQTVPMVVEYTRTSGAGPVVINIPLPSLIQVDPPPAPANCSVTGAPGAQTLDCSVNPGVGATETLTINVRGRAIGGGSVTATAGTSSATQSFTVVAAGDLGIAKSIAPGTNIVNGATATFTLTPSLSGDPVPGAPSAETIRITDTLPGAATEFQITAINAPGYTCNTVADAQTTRSVRCDATGPLSSVGPITITGRPTTAGAGGLINTAAIAVVGNNYVDLTPDNNTANVPFNVVPGTDVQAQGSFPSGQVVVGTPQTLTITYRNNGPQTTNGGQIRTAIPGVFTIGTLPAGCVNSGAGTVNGVSGTVITCTTGTVTSGGSQPFAIPVTGNSAPTSGNFGVEIITPLPGGITDNNPANNQVLVPYNIVPPFADLSIAKSKTGGPLPAGADITNTLTVTNNGPAAASFSAGSGATPLRVIDDVSMDEEFVSASAG